MIVVPKCLDKVISKVFVQKVFDDGPADTHGEAFGTCILGFFIHLNNFVHFILILYNKKGIIEGDEVILINEKQVAGMKPLTLQQQLRGIKMHVT